MTADLTIRDGRIEEERTIAALWDAAYQDSARSQFDDIGACWLILGHVVYSLWKQRAP
ncbi:MAG TPA: hypothetical protein VFY10_16560 [Dehalococcoidia bacterium]|nr:hypothetical protein [Dehalococcoidia bacterium]